MVEECEWDPEKARRNLAKHGVSFAEAVVALTDPLASTIPDPDALAERRFVTLGEDDRGRLLVVIWAWRNRRIRLISARRATRHERRRYEEP